MLIDKIINNNIIYNFDNQGNELIAMGRGIGFSKKHGDEIPDHQIEKIFRVESTDLVNQLTTLLSSIPTVYFEISDMLIEHAESNLNLHLNQNIYLTLTDHLNFTVERFKKDIFPDNPFLWELEKFYEKEFSLGLYALDLLNEKLNVSMTEDEAGFIAMHFINAEYMSKMNTSFNFPNLFKDIVFIVQSELNIDLKEPCLCYEQFVIQLKCLVDRIYNREYITFQDAIFEQFLIKRYEKSYRCAAKIIQYIVEYTGIEVAKDETLLLTLHLQTVLVHDTNQQFKN